MTLHPQAQDYLAQMAAVKRAPWHETPLAESRTAFSSLTPIFGRGPEMHSVQDFRTPDGIPLRFYRPRPAAPSQPVIMFFHGGGFVIGDLDTHDSTCRRLAAAAGYPLVAVEYRRAPEHRYPAALDDCLAATQFVSESASDLNVDAKRILVAGDSAGGNLAAGVALRVRDERRSISLAGQVLIYPVVEPNFETQSYREFAEGHGLTLDTMRWFWQQYLPNSDLDLRYAVLSADLSGLPSAHVVTAEYDVLRDEGESLADRLRSAKVPTTVRRYEGMIHGFVHFGGVFDHAKLAAEDIGKVMRAMCG